MGQRWRGDRVALQGTQRALQGTQRRPPKVPSPLCKSATGYCRPLYHSALTGRIGAVAEPVGQRWAVGGRVAGYAATVAGYAGTSPGRRRPPTRRRHDCWPPQGPQGPRGASCDEGGRFGGREPIFKFSHTKSFPGNRLSPNELRLACEPLTGPRRVYKWERKIEGRK